MRSMTIRIVCPSVAAAVCAAAIGAFSAAASIAAAQGEPAGGDMAAMMAKWAKVAAPSEHHKHVDIFVGKWTTATRMWMGGPDAPPSESAGTSEIAWVLDGRFVREEHSGRMAGEPYQGIGLTGYDNYKNMYVGTWANDHDPPDDRNARSIGEAVDVLRRDG